jgi:hypothetical protein
MTTYDTGTGSGGATLRADVNLASQSQAGNSSVVSVNLDILNVGSATYVNSGVQCGIYVNGWDYTTFTWASGGGSRVIQSGNYTVQHDANGYATASIAGYIGATGTSGIGGPTQIPTGSYSLPRIPKAPSAPTSPSVVAGTGQATLSWATPGDNGGSGITGYRMYYSLNSNMSSASSTDVGAVTSGTVTGLTPGSTYYFTIAAINGIGLSPTTSAVSTFIGGVASAPLSPAATAIPQGLGVTWATPATNNGVPITGYLVEIDTSSSFTAPVANTVGATLRAFTLTNLLSSTPYYARISAINSVGNSTPSTTATATTPARTTLDIVQGATVDVSGGNQVEIRSDGADVPTLTLGYTAFGTGTTFVAIATIATNVAGGFATPGGSRNIDLVSDPAGNLYVIGRDASNPSAVRVTEYARSAATTWALGNSLSQAFTNTGDGLVAFGASYVPGTGGTPTPAILVVARRSGTVGAGSLSYATISVANVQANSGALFVNSGSDPAWLNTPPTSQAINTGVVDVTALVDQGTRLAVLANSFAVVDVINAVVTGVSVAAAGATTVGPWARILGVGANTLAVLSVASGALAWSFYTATSGALLGSGSFAGSNFQGGAAASQWDTYYDRVAALIRVHYVDAAAGAREVSNITISPTSYANTPNTLTTAALGAASSTNSLVRLAGGTVDERRVILSSANILTGTKSTSAYSITEGNVAPNAPALVHVPGFDATQAYTFAWAFSDPNPADAQATYDLQIQRVSDSVNVVAVTGIASSTASRLVAANTLANPVAYRWRVRVTDALAVQGAWSSYDSFSTAAIGTLTITNPAADNPAGLIIATIPLTWTYSQVNGYVQTQYRIRVLNVATSAVISDTGMQASTATSANVGVPTDVQVTIELSVVTNAPCTPTVVANRVLTSSYSTPPAATATLSQGVSFVLVQVANPVNVGSKPNATSNYIDRTLTGTTAWVAIAHVAPNASYKDHAVASGTSYDYRVRAEA